MRNASLKLLVVAFAFALTAGVALADHHSWTGEVLDIQCYEKQGAHGEAHADCAKKCVKGGAPMGLLTDDGTVVLLKAGKDAAPYESLKDLAGEMAEVTGELAEKDGKKVLTVTGAKAAA